MPADDCSVHLDVAQARPPFASGSGGVFRRALVLPGLLTLAAAVCFALDLALVAVALVLAASEAR